MIRALSDRLSRLASRGVPDPLSIAVLLTFGTMLWVWAATDATPLDVLGYWGGRVQGGKLIDREEGLMALLEFAMQMCLVLVTGAALAASPPIERGIRALARWPSTPARAVALTALLAMGTSLVNWGLGLVVGALAAREVGLSARQRGVPVHYPLLGAAGYTGITIWHGGLSGSAPLRMTQAAQAEVFLGQGAAGIPLEETLGSPLNLTVCGLLLVAIPLLLVAMHPRVAEPVDLARFPDLGGSHRDPEPAATTRLDRSRLPSLCLGLLVAGYLVEILGLVGLGKADLNTVNLAFLALGLCLHPSLDSYGRSITGAISGCSGILLQFPLYAGIMGLMKSSGLGRQIAASMASVGAEWHGVVTYLSAGFLNLFIPSGGGQWSVQAEIVVQSAREAGVPLGDAIMAFCYGDEWTNLLQPFWALPLLGITRLRVQELIGYTALLMLLIAPIYLGCLYAF